MTIEQNEYLSQLQLQILAEKAIKNYSEEYQGDISLLCQSENATFLIKKDLKRFALRIHRPNYHSKQQIESELLWLDALRESGMEVPVAIPNKFGDTVQTLYINHETFRHCVLFNWIEGVMPTIESIKSEDFKQLGSINAKLHLNSKQWKKPDNFTRIIWDHQTMTHDDGHWGDWKNAPNLKKEDHIIVNESLQRISNELKQFGKSEDRYGLIHADLRLTNLLINANKVGVIDFDDCGMSWYMHDLAAAISFNEHFANAPSWVEKWLNGYELNAHITHQEYNLIPTFIMQRRIQLMAWVGSHSYTDMAQSLGTQWIDESIRLCKKYLSNQIPAGK